MGEAKAANTLKDLPAQLDQEGWYVGLLPEAHSEELLKRKGDFVVRLSETQNENKFKLVVKADKKLYHLPINTENNLWFLASRRKNQFKTVTDLIEFFKKNDLSVGDEMGIRLVRPVQKPRFLLKRRDVKVDKKLLGSGNFCDIYKGLYREKRHCALKICHISNTADEAPVQVGEANNMIAEAKLMRSIDHPNIVKFYGICCDQTPVMIVMELCPGGSLLRHLTREGTRITTGERIKFSAEAAGGMNHLHSKDVVHRDLAARNCLISKNGVVKIGDFGLSKIVSDLAGENLKNMQIPLRWMAPETLTDKPQFSKASDVWAYGVLLFEIFSYGQKPWPDWENKRIATHIRRNKMVEFPSTAPGEVRRVVNEGLWHKDPTKRLDFRNITRLFLQISIKYPAPVLDKLTVNNIPDVCAMGNEEPAFLFETAEDTVDALPTTMHTEIDIKLKRFVESPTYTDDQQHSNKKKLQKKTSLKKKNQEKTATVSLEVSEEKVTQGSEEEKGKTLILKGKIDKLRPKKLMESSTPPATKNPK